MSTVGNPRDYLILTNNPLVVSCMEGRGLYTIEFHPEMSYREILVLARDKVYIGHTLYTHPLSGSVKPNETPYKSVIVSMEPHGFDQQQAEIMSNAIAVCDKFVPCNRQYTQQVLEDFQLIDYTLLSGAIGFDAAAGLSNRQVLVIKSKKEGGVHFEIGTGLYPDQ